ncbi:MAG TPA: glycine betaine ABC transporter substrate-binding protein [Candidatus Limnocylindrales bacterium]|nr:glycine betaine ABC transporter substrate-binding protein [Candidatus Limnocylindrales bacterium]
MIDRRAFLSGALLWMLGCRPRSGGVTVGSKNFTEQLVLGEMLAQVVEASIRMQVDRRFYLAGTYICHQALLAGRIDMYVEYTGTALSAVLKEKPAPGTAEAGHAEVFATVKREYARRFGLEVMPPLGFDNSFAIVMRGDDARLMHIRTLSQLAAAAPQLRMGVGYEFLERPDGYKGLVGTYGLHFAEEPRVMDLGLLYRALESRQVDVVVGSNTDGLIAALGLVVLADDRHYFPPYDAVPIVRRDCLEKYPAAQDALLRLAGKITADDMRRLNYAVDGEKKDASAVVREFLRSKDL